MSSSGVEHMLDRLRDEITRAGYQTLAEASRAAGDESAQGLRDVVSGRKRCSVEYLMRLGAIGIDVTFVMTGRRDSAPGVSTQRVSDGATLGMGSSPPSADAVAVNMYDVEGAAGDGRSLEDERVEGVLYFPEAQLNALGLSPERIAGIKVRGDSMEETLADGDWVLVNQADTDYRREGVFLLLVSGERRIKRVQRLAGGALYLISDNEHYEPEMIPPEQMREVQILGRCEVRIGRIA